MCFSTVPTECPSDFPFASGGGTVCCKFFNRRINTTANAACDGGPLKFDDPADCCQPFLPCNDTFDGCRDHPFKESKF